MDEMIPLTFNDPRVFFFHASYRHKKEARLIPAHLIDVYYPHIEPEYHDLPQKYLILAYFRNVLKNTQNSFMIVQITF